jgi:hypothetical protein
MGVVHRPRGILKDSQRKTGEKSVRLVEPMIEPNARAVVLNIIDKQRYDCMQKWLAAHRFSHANDRVRIDGRTMTPLHLAVLQRDERMVKLLCIYNADLQAVNDQQLTPLRYAVLMDNGDGANAGIVKRLMKRAHNLAKLERSNMSPKEKKQICETIREEVLESNARKFLHREKFDSVKSTRTVKKFLRSTKQEAPLHVAVEINDIELVEALLLAGAKLEARNHKGFTPLELAQQSNSSEAILDLLAAFKSTGDAMSSMSTFDFSDSSQSSDESDLITEY